MMNNNEIMERLMQMKNECDYNDTLTKDVIDIIIKEGDDEIAIFINDIIEYGLMNNPLSCLTYDSQIEPFFMQHAKQILSICDENRSTYTFKYDVMDMQTLTYFAIEFVIEKLQHEI